MSKKEINGEREGVCWRKGSKAMKRTQHWKKPKSRTRLRSWGKWGQAGNRSESKKPKLEQWKMCRNIQSGGVHSAIEVLLLLVP